MATRLDDHGPGHSPGNRCITNEPADELNVTRGQRLASLAVTIELTTLDDPAGVAMVTINRPERRNALDRDALAQLRAALATVATNGTRVLVMTGAGKNFCAGADLSTVEDDAFVGELRGTLEDLRGMAIPVLAAIHGPALGAGTQLAMACDLRIATPDATFGIPAAKLGLTVDHYTVHHLADAVGHSIARAMLLGAEVFDARQLAESGFVHRLVDADGDLDLHSAAIVWAGRLARLAPLTIAAHKAMLADVEAAGEPSEGAREARRRAWESADLAAGLVAFAEKRLPEFEGR